MQTPESCKSENIEEQLLSQQSQLQEPLTPSFAEPLSFLTAVLDPSRTALPANGGRRFPVAHMRPQSKPRRVRRTKASHGRNRRLESEAMRIETVRINLNHEHSQSERPPKVDTWPPLGFGSSCRHLTDAVEHTKTFSLTPIRQTSTCWNNLALAEVKWVPSFLRLSLQSCSKAVGQNLSIHRCRQL